MKKELRDTIYIYLLHLSGWMCFLFYPFFLGVPFRTDLLIKFFLHTILLAIFFYTNTNLLIPRILSRKQVALWFFTVSGIIGLIVLLNFAINHFLVLEPINLVQDQQNPMPPPPNLEMRRIARAVFSSMFILAFSTSYKLLTDWFQAERKLQAIEKENLTSELSFLRSQVSPHFLFNTLNNIYSLSLTSSDKTPEAILKLSRLLRYMLYESEAKQVLLTGELEYLHNYIDLQKMRCARNTEVSFVVEGEIEGKKIEPMLLIPFVENAFKHGINCSGGSKICIQLICMPESLRFNVTNNTRTRTEPDPASGIGLANVCRRLDLLYPDKHSLEIEDGENVFNVNLKIQMKR
jgi:two-component system, LytTR family, sensor kinase